MAAPKRVELLKVPPTADAETELLAGEAKGEDRLFPRAFAASGTPNTAIEIASVKGPVGG